MADGRLSDAPAKQPLQQLLTDIIETGEPGTNKKASSNEKKEGQSLNAGELQQENSLNTTSQNKVSDQITAQYQRHEIPTSFFILFRNLPEPAILTDGKKVIDANESLLSLCGYSREEVYDSKLSKVIKKGKLYKRDGEPIEVSVREIRIGLVSVMIFDDEVEKKNREIVYKRLELLENSLLEPVVSVDKHGKIRSWNAAALNFFGVGDLEGQNIKSLVKGNKLAGKMKTALTENKLQKIEAARPKVGSNDIEVEIDVMPMEEGAVCLIRDVSERKSLKRQINEAKEQYEQLVNNVTDIICIIDKRGNFKFTNRQFEKQLGYSKDKLPVLTQLIHPEDLADVLRKLNECENMGKGFQDLEFRLQSAKKRYLYYSASGVPTKDGANVTGFSVTMRDITLKKKSEDETAIIKRNLEQENKQLNEINKIKTEFVSMVSHDLKTPLTNIQGYSSLMRNNVLGPNNPKQQEAAEVIHKESIRLTKLINDILDLSKLDSGAMTLHQQPFKLSQLEEKCSFASVAEQKGLTIIWNTPDSLGEAYGDPERIAQVLSNLVSNAIKFTDRGSVTVNAFLKDKSHIQIDVIDTGAGIPKKEQQKIFERFQRGTASKILKKEGSGLGLSIAKDIMKLHGSDIFVSSEVGKGSTFSILLQRIPNRDLPQQDSVDKYIENMSK